MINTLAALGQRELQVQRAIMFTLDIINRARSSVYSILALLRQISSEHRKRSQEHKIITSCERGETVWGNHSQR